MRRVHSVEPSVVEAHVVHVHDENVRALRDEVDADDITDTRRREQVELDRVSATDAKHR